MMEKMTETHVPSTAKESGDAIPAADARASSWRSFILQVSTITLLLVCLLVGHAFWRTRSPALVWPYLAGQRLFVVPSQLSLGPVPRKTQTIEREVRVINTGSKPVQLLGAQRTCDCIALDEFPIVVSAGEAKPLRLKIGMPRKPAPFEHSIKFFSDEHGYASSFVLKINGSVP